MKANIQTPTGEEFVFSQHPYLSALAGETMDAAALYERTKQLPPGFPCPLFGRPLYALKGQHLHTVAESWVLLCAPTKITRLSRILTLLTMRRDSLVVTKEMAR
jgi:hypothetical protein